MKYMQRSTLAAAAIGALLLAASIGAVAGPAERAQAKRIHDRIAGVPPSAAILDLMEQDIVNGGEQGARQAARRAMLAPSFYNATLKNWVTPWTNREQSVFAPLNDYTATVIGMVRDDVDFRQVLSGDILYVGGTGLPGARCRNRAPASVSRTSRSDRLDAGGRDRGFKSHVRSEARPRLSRLVARKQTSGQRARTRVASSLSGAVT
jgi:hypothetical protein